MQATDGPLRGIRVATLGHRIAGPYAAALLADLGAHVIQVRQPGSVETCGGGALPLRPPAQALAVDLGDAEDRRRVHELIAGVDVVVMNFRLRTLERWGLSPQRLVLRHPRLVVLSMPGFASDDPRADLPGWEGVVMAAAGAYAGGSVAMLGGEWMSEVAQGFTPLPLASMFAAALGALGVVSALIERERSGHGQAIEVSLHDAFLEAIGSRGARYERPALNWTFLGSGVYRCADGITISVITVWHRHLRWLLDALGWDAERIASEAAYDLLMGSEGARRALREELVRAFASRPARHWEELGRAHGVPIARLRKSGEWLEHERDVHAGGVTRDGGRWTPRPPVRIRAHDGAPTALRKRPSDRSGPLAGLRVVDMTRVLAGPTAARLLSDLGADVVRADVDPTAMQAGHREPFFHEVVNRGKRLVEVDARTGEGREVLNALLDQADVFVTNFTTRALLKLGTDAATLGAARPGLVHVRVAGFEEDGAWSAMRGYAEIANTVTGLTAETIPETPPSGVAPNIDLPRMPYTDHLAGVFAALGAVAGVFGRLRDGRGRHVVTALTDAAYAAQLPFIGDAWGAWRTRAHPEVPGWSPSHRLHRTADGRIFAALPPGMSVAESFAALTTAEAIEAVARAGGVAHAVCSLDDLVAEEGPLAGRGMLVEFESPEYGRIVQFALPIRFSRTPVSLPTHPQTAVPDGLLDAASGFDDHH